MVALSIADAASLTLLTYTLIAMGCVCYAGWILLKILSNDRKIKECLIRLPPIRKLRCIVHDHSGKEKNVKAQLLFSAQHCRDRFLNS